jgi:xylulokinase
MSTPELILAHDVGTSGNKVTLYAPDGSVLGRAFNSYETYYPRAGWAEQDPADWWSAVRAGTHQVFAGARARPDDVACVSFSGMMQACLPVDVRGMPLRHCIIWADQRATSQAARLSEQLGGDRIYRITGHRVSPTYSLAKMLWVRDEEPDVWAAAHKFLHVKDYIVYRLTGHFATDRSDASGMNLYDLARSAWSAEILAGTGVDIRLLPEVHNSSDVVGYLTPAAASELGLCAGIPVVIGGGDGACAAIGAGAIRPGIAYNYLGSSAWVAFTSPVPLYDDGATFMNFASLQPGQFMPCGSMQSAGASYQWLRRQVCTAEDAAAGQAGVDVYELMNLLAESAPPGAQNLLFLPYLMGERSPLWDPHARGAFVGLTARHTRADLVRATLEGITMHLKSIVDTFLAAGTVINEMRVIGGGGKGRFWRQLMADIYGLSVLRPRLLEEATSLGAAIAGGVGAGLYPSFDVADDLIEIVDRHQPDLATLTTYERLFPVWRSAYQALRPVYEQLHALEV